MGPTAADYHLDSPKMKPMVTTLGTLVVQMAGGHAIDFKNVVCTATNCEQYHHGIIIMAKDKVWMRPTAIFRS